jgi:hypothetical protein
MADITTFTFRMALGLTFLFDGIEKKKSHHPYSREKVVLARKSDYDEVDGICAKLKGDLLVWLAP